MVNRRNSSGSKKPGKTIDLEANKTAEEAIDDVVDETMAGSSGYDILKPQDEQKSASEVTESNASGDEEAGEDVAEKQGTSSETLDTSNENQEDGIVQSIPPTAQPAPKPRGFGSMLLSAILGGGVALGGASLIGENSALKSVPVIGELLAGNSEPGVDVEKINLLSSQITALNSQVEALQAASGSDPIAAEALELAKSSETMAQAASAKIDELANQALENPNGAPINLDALKTAIAGDQVELIERISALETNGSSSLTERVDGELASIKEEMTKLAALDQSSKTMGEKLSSLDERLKTLETTVGETVLPSMVSVQAAAGAAVESQKVARSVSARALGSVLENGGSFAGELAAAEALIGQSENISALKALAGKGILNQAALANEFNSVSDKILSAETTASADDSIVGKLFSSAKTLVKVRPAGPIDGESNTAIVSRIASNLNSGNLAEALTQWNTLSEAAKSVSSDWEARAQDRLQAEKHLNNIIGELGLSSPNQG